MKVGGFDYKLADVMQRYGLERNEAKAFCKEVLDWGEDYRAGGRQVYVITQAGMEKLEAHMNKRNALFVADEDETIDAVVHRIQPKNPRCIFVVAPEIEGKGVCQVPLRLSQQFRKPGKKLSVRHVDGNTYQIVLKAWRHEQEDRYIG